MRWAREWCRCVDIKDTIPSCTLTFFFPFLSSLFFFVIVFVYVPGFISQVTRERERGGIGGLKATVHVYSLGPFFSL